MRINDIFPSNYFKAADLDGEQLQVVMDRVEMEQLQDGTQKAVLYFANQDKGLMLNKTNANAIATVYGDDTDAWTGHSVTLISVPVDFQGRQVDAIRVRAKPQARRPQQQPQQRQPQPEYGQAKGRVQSGKQLPPQDDLDDTIPF